MTTDIINATPVMDRPCADLTCECCHPENWCRRCIARDADEASIGSIFSCRFCHSVYQKTRVEDSPHFDSIPERVRARLMNGGVSYTCFENRMYMGPPPVKI